MAHRLHTFAGGADLAEALATRVAGALADGIAARGRASIAVSGGSTPKAFFRALSAKDIDWSGVVITLVDERFVPPESDRSNHGLVSAGLLQDKAAAASFVPLYHAVADAGDAALLASDDLRRIPQPFDVAVLGMGGDGHTASFFPGGDNLARALDPKTPRGVMTMRAEGAGEERLTLTFSALRDARLLVLHIETEEKKNVLETALAQGAAGPLPIARVIGAAASDIEIYWAP
ncbi:MAG: 6-phosphogluconolactonase [Rhizobiaceae bacterium]|nr:6-phosphogluconolactonase [Rhizobiaceae bacterium]